MLKAIVGVASCLFLFQQLAIAGSNGERSALNSKIEVIPHNIDTTAKFGVVDLKKRYRILPKFSEKQVECLATTLYAEAKGRGEFGMVLVGNVILNRLEHSDFPETVCGVVKQKGQFVQKKYTDPTVKIIAKNLLMGYYPDTTKGALFFDNNGFMKKYRKFIMKSDGHFLYR